MHWLTPSTKVAHSSPQKRKKYTLKILLTGANGFIASAIIENLIATNISVIACARSRKNIPTSNKLEFHQVDFNDYQTVSDWLPLLESVDVVINCAGILREKHNGDFDRIHYAVPKALLQACVEQDVQKFIQISALGSIDDGAFIASKHKFDEYLINSSLHAIVIRPSVVVSLRGSYGGTSLLRALAALPLVIFLPGRGDQQIQPILLEDLAAIVCKTTLQDASDNKIIYAVGPEILSIKQYLGLLRTWLKLAPARFINLPTWFITFAVWLGQKLAIGPLGQTIHTMLERGNIGPDNSFQALVKHTGHTPQSVSKVLSSSASFVQDRWHARLYFLTPALWFMLVFVWIMSGIAGFLAAPARYQALLHQLFVPTEYQRLLVLATSALDVILGVALLLKFKVNLILALMLCSVLGYTALIGFFVPSLWLEPLGSLLKNLPIILLILIYWAIEDKR